MGSGRKLTSLANSCGICGNELQDYSHLGEEVGCSSSRRAPAGCDRPGCQARRSCAQASAPSPGRRRLTPAAPRRPPARPPQSNAERCVQLNCKHCFHDLCIRGWTMVGKKDTCPVCLEKVDMRMVHDKPWDSTNLSWWVPGAPPAAGRWLPGPALSAHGGRAGWAGASCRDQFADRSPEQPAGPSARQLAGRRAEPRCCLPPPAGSRCWTL
jgi:hypothetical protein